MRILFVDTETNGLPKNRWAPPTMKGAWPAVVQIAWQVLECADPNTRTPLIPLYESSFIIAPEAGTVWSEEAAAIHGITEGKATQEGKPVESVLRGFASDAAECDIVVAHNLAFDKPVLWAAVYRHQCSGVADPATWWPKREICTMLETKEVCRIPSTSKWVKPMDPYKWPRLAELWTFLWPAKVLPENLHDAGQDVRVLVACFDELVRRRLLVLPEISTRRSWRFVDFLRGLFG